MKKVKQTTYADRQLITDADMLFRMSKNLEGEPWLVGNFAVEVCFDCSDCDSSTLTRSSVKQYIEQVSSLIDLSSKGLRFTGYSSTPKLVKNLEVKVASTGNVTVRIIPLIMRVYVNIISSKPFRDGRVHQFTWDWFKAKWCRGHRIVRG